MSHWRPWINKRQLPELLQHHIQEITDIALECEKNNGIIDKIKVIKHWSEMEQVGIIIYHKWKNDSRLDIEYSFKHRMYFIRLYHKNNQDCNRLHIFRAIYSAFKCLKSYGN